MKSIEIKITDSKRTKKETWFVGEFYGRLEAFPENRYSVDMSGEPLYRVQVEREAMYPGTYEEWTCSIAGRIVEALA